jgi:Glycosyl hydrolase family 26
MNRRKFLKLAAGTAIGAGLLARLPRSVLASAQSSVYWGAYISGKTYGINPATGLVYGNAPWDLSTWDLFESHAGKKVSILHWGQSWYASASWPYGYCSFLPSLANTVRSRGAIPLLDWSSRDQSLGGSLNQPTFSLANIISGVHDAFIAQWATDAKAWGFPFFLRFDWEMNGNWFVWSEGVNGNSPGQFVAAWRHVHDIFTSVGANNVTWVWCPNIDSSTMIPMASLYPGDAYVDWTALDGYNKYSTWLAYNQVFAAAGITWLYDSYHEVLSLAPTKPMMLGEFASLEAGDGGAQKSAWITDALTVQIPANFPAIKAIVWFNWNSDLGSTYVIESSAAAQSAFAAGIASSLYSANDFANLPFGAKVMPLNPGIATAAPTATRTSTALPTKTNTPAPTVTATSVSTNTPAPTATSTSTALPTNTKTPTATVTRTPMQTPIPTKRHGKPRP